MCVCVCVCVDIGALEQATHSGSFCQLLSQRVEMAGTKNAPSHRRGNCAKWGKSLGGAQVLINPTPRECRLFDDDWPGKNTTGGIKRNVYGFSLLLDIFFIIIENWNRGKKVSWGVAFTGPANTIYHFLTSSRQRRDAFHRQQRLRGAPSNLLP